MIRIVYREDGGVSIITPASKSKQENETEFEWLKRVFDKATPANVEYKDTNEFLPDRRFRNAWGKGITRDVEVNLSKAKEQVMVELRSTRDEELNKTDGLMSRATEIGTQKEINDLKTYRQKLRDLPQTMNIEAIATVNDLQNSFPETVTINRLKTLGEL